MVRWGRLAFSSCRFGREMSQIPSTAFLNTTRLWRKLNSLLQNYVACKRLWTTSGMTTKCSLSLTTNTTWMLRCKKSLKARSSRSAWESYFLFLFRHPHINFDKVVKLVYNLLEELNLEYGVVLNELNAVESCWRQFRAIQEQSNKSKLLSFRFWTQSIQVFEEDSAFHSRRRDYRVQELYWVIFLNTHTAADWWFEYS